MKRFVAATFRVCLNDVSARLWSLQGTSPSVPERCGLPKAHTTSRVDKNWVTIACVLVVALSAAAAGQNAGSSHSGAGRGLSFFYNPEQETVLVGRVKDLTLRPVSGTPAGLHLLVSNDAGVVDVHVGPYLCQELRDALQGGQLVQVTGATEKIHGKQVLLARQLVFQGHLVTVRNERGFLVRDPHTFFLLNAKKHVANGGLR